MIPSYIQTRALVSRQPQRHGRAIVIPHGFNDCTAMVCNSAAVAKAALKLEPYLHVPGDIFDRMRAAVVYSDAALHAAIRRCRRHR